MKSLLLLAFFLASTCSFAQNQPFGAYVNFGGDYQIFQDAYQLSNEIIYAGGHSETQPGSNLDQDVTLAKIAPDGSVLWSTMIPSGGSQSCLSMRPSLDSTAFVFSGYEGSGIQKGFVMLVDTAGNELWKMEHGYPNANLHFEDVVPTLDGGYLAFGFREGGGASYAAFATKFDSAGTYLWEHDYVFGFSNYQYGQEIERTDDGGFMILSNVTASFLFPSVVVAWLAKIDQNGSVVWDTYVHFAGLDAQAEGLHICDNGDFLLGGSTRDGTSNTRHQWLARVDSIGQLKWQQNYVSEGQHNCFDIVERGPNEIIATGFGGYNVLYAFTTDSSGNVVTKDYYRATSNLSASQGRSITIGVNDHIIISGASQAGTYLSIVLVLDTSQTLVISEHAQQQALEIYPNPSSSGQIINLGQHFNKAAIELYDTQGRLIAKEEEFRAASYQLPNHLKNGLYFLNITDGNLQWTARLFVQ